MSEKIRLNIGAGGSNLPGFIPLDIQTGTDATKPLPYADGSVDEIYASHVLEHIHHSLTYPTVKEWVRVLKPGGRIRIAVPDSARIAEAVASGKMEMEMYSAWMYGSHDVATDRHQAVFSEGSLDLLLRAMGIDSIAKWKAEYDDCSRLPLSLNMGGYKRQTLINPNPKVVMILSTGRFGPTDLYHGVAELCRVKGWKLYQWGGDNWAKALTQLIKGAIANENPDYVMTLDFDSALDASEMAKIVDFMQEHPEIGAAWPVQAHRHQDAPLGMSPSAAAIGYYDFSSSNPWKGEFTAYSPGGSGHFGCTVIRRQVFDVMPHPWLQGLPSIESGDWDSNSLDNDISFWISMGAHGFTFGQMNRIQIGHMEWSVKWVAGDRCIAQSIQSYRKHGRPKIAVFDGEAWNAKCRKNRGLPDATVVPAVELAPEPVVAINQTIAGEYFPPLDSAKVSAQLAELNREIEQKLFPPNRPPSSSRAQSAARNPNQKGKPMAKSTKKGGKGGGKGC